MVKGLSTNQRKRGDSAFEAYLEAGVRAEAAWRVYRDAVAGFNGAVECLDEFLEEIRDEMRDYMADRSDAWHESDRAAQCEEFLERWEAFTVTSVEEPERPEIADADEWHDLPLNVGDM